MNSYLKEIARSIFLKTLEQIDPRDVISQHISREGNILQIDDARFDLNKYEKILVIGFGKASLKMGAGLESLLTDKDIAGMLATNALLDDVRPERLEVTVGGHPYPDAGSLAAARRAMELVSEAGEDTLICYLVSGGGSSLIERPIDDSISLLDLREMNRLLVTGGARIREINTVRKHLSAIKGGRLAALGRHSTQISLYISDVNRADLATIASDPTGPDDTTLTEFYEVIDKYDLNTKLPASIARLVKDRQMTETPKQHDGLFERSSRFLLMDNVAMLETAASLARTSGWITTIDAGDNEEHYQIVADRLLSQLEEMRQTNPTVSICLVSGGEVSCPVTGNGIGGRNQEFVLYCAERLDELAGRLPGYELLVLSAGSDGIDGNSTAAGAVADNETMTCAEGLGINAEDYLRRNDSFNFFAKLGDALMTGPTGTNVRDLRLLMARPK